MNYDWKFYFFFCSNKNVLITPSEFTAVRLGSFCKAASGSFTNLYRPDHRGFCFKVWLLSFSRSLFHNRAFLWLFYCLSIQQFNKDILKTYFVQKSSRRIWRRINPVWPGCKFQFYHIETTWLWKSLYGLSFNCLICNIGILMSFVDYEGYSISSKGFLPTVVDIMVIWNKFPHSGPF